MSKQGNGANVLAGLLLGACWGPAADLLQQRPGGEDCSRRGSATRARLPSGPQAAVPSVAHLAIYALVRRTGAENPRPTAERHNANLKFLAPS